MQFESEIQGKPCVIEILTVSRKRKSIKWLVLDVGGCLDEDLEAKMTEDDKRRIDQEAWEFYEEIDQWKGYE